MSWWARLRLRGKIFLALAALIVALLLLTLGLVQLSITSQTERTVNEQLKVTGQVFRRLVAERAARLRTNSTLLAGDFALKRAIATYDESTLTSVALNYQRRIGVDLLWITDEKGVLLADSRGRRKAGETPFAGVLRDALAGGGATAVIAELDGGLFQIVAVPVLGPDVIGGLVLATSIDDATARQLRRETGSVISFLTAERLFASSLSSRWRAQLFPGDRMPADWSSHTGGEPFLAVAGGERWLSLLVPIAADLPAPLFTVVQRSYDDALAPLVALRRRILAIGGVALGLALLVGAGLAGGITAPIQTLVAGMRQVLQGDFGHRLRVERQDEIGFLSSSFNEMVAGLEEREQIKETFGRYVSRPVAEAILSKRLPLAGERREVTILFQDIRGFTTISEQFDPAALVGILNQFFTEVVAAVEAEGGVIRQFTGDGVMALFGAPEAHPDDPERAVRAALAMVARLGPLNQRFAAAGLPALRIGIGIHTGEVIVGKMGPDTRLEYNVIGDPVNTASRIEGLTKEVHTTILVSSVTAARLGPAIRLGRSLVLPIRGKEHPVEVVEILV